MQDGRAKKCKVVEKSLNKKYKMAEQKQARGQSKSKKKM
jgi:hypothetical protein